ncbi:GIY-YIG nuclease family protein [Natronococcus pandeyae]|nr:GIY-YIG nuclease family protein [Natronococcus pandeyae]
MTTKAELWDDWIERSLLTDISSSETPDPVPMIETSGGELETIDEFDSYRYGRGDGQYLYLLYLIDEPMEQASDVIPVYIGETNSITSRLYQHFKKIRDALPTEDWEDDGSWGSWSKYDHMAAVYEHADSPLYAWILDVEELDAGPYGHSSYRQELEAKLVGLVHSQSRFEREFANREFVPNRVVHEMGKVGPKWLTGAESYEPTSISLTADGPLTGKSKTDLWHDWVEETILHDIQDPSEADPIPLFETNEELKVKLTPKEGLKRSDAIDEQIRREGKRCVSKDGVPPNCPDGLLYVMYQLAPGSDDLEPADVIPRYIGKAEAYGKKNELSANFTEIAFDRDRTGSFARWGDGDYWHIGELSNTVFGREEKKLAWASELFEQGSRTLKRQTYLWIRAWDSDAYRGPYGYDAYLAEAEPLLIGLAQDAYPSELLNYSGAPDDAPIKSKDHQFETLSE